MPEIKNVFQQGKMNKDLDERLVPNGEYRDAMNLQVASSEESSVGTAQNILGNKRVEAIIGADFKCVGAIADEKNDVLYWFVTSAAVDAIIEYHDNGIVTPILVDRNKDVLKFDYNDIITGISIIDDFIFWTDNVNEPKKINIKTFKLNNVEFQGNPPNHNGLSVHSMLYIKDNLIGDVKEDHITVIRKKPYRAPTVIFKETSYNKVHSLGEDSNGDVQTLNLFGVEADDPIIFDYYLPQPLTGDNPPWLAPDILVLDEISSTGLPNDYKLKLQIDSEAPILDGNNDLIGAKYTCTVIEIFGVWDDEEIEFLATKFVDKKEIFEKEFIRFATRYKYNDNEYSAFSPFTDPIFMAGAFGFHPTEDPYNLAMENTTVVIMLQELIPPNIPRDVVQVDILFKKENSTTVYSVDSIKIDDPYPANYWHKDNSLSPHVYNMNNGPTALLGTGGVSAPFSFGRSGEYEITTENIYAALPENQMLRPWDNVPRRALAQEITANRVVYGNYLQNYSLKTLSGDTIKPQIEVDYEERLSEYDYHGTNSPDFSGKKGLKHIKSLRNYTIGVVYGDKYGRETPVFTSKNASISIPFDLNDDPLVFDGAANKSLRLLAKLNGPQPEFAHYFKYYIKQTTGEYYNLTMDRVYKAAGDSNLWISFPSSDRNKIQEGDYFSIKKQVDIEEIIPVENKIKIIDIKNEAPDTIKFDYVSIGTGGGSASDLASLFPDASAQPGAGIKRLLIDKDHWTTNENGLDIEDLTRSDKLAVQFSIQSGTGTVRSKKYFVSGYSLEDNGTTQRYNLLLKKPIDEEDSWVESSPGVLNSAEVLTITIFRLEEKDAVEFEGRFFVKIISSFVTQTYLIPSTTDTYARQILGSLNCFQLKDHNTNAAPDGTSSIKRGFNVSTSSSGHGAGNTNALFSTPTTAFYSDSELDFEDISAFDGTNTVNQGWFIDSLGFAATQQNDTVYAEKSGKMYKGINGVLSNAVKSQYVNSLEGIISPTISGQDITAPSSWSTTSGGTPQGARHWYTKVHELEELSHSWNNPEYGTSPGPSNYDNAYVPVQGGGHWMHLSFMAPGEDLHDGDHSDFQRMIDTNYTPNTGRKMLEKLWENGAVPFLQHICASTIWIDGYDSGGGNAWNDNKWNYPSFAENCQPSSKALGQWDPGYNNASAQSIVNNLEPGSRFIIEGDINEIVYTIKRVNIKRFYNHTAWNYMPILKEDGTVSDLPSVSRVLDEWFDSMGGGLTADWESSNHDTELANLKETITAFGRANNRRTCYILQLDKDPRDSIIGTTAFPGAATATASQLIRFIDDYIEPGENRIPVSPAIFETEAKEEQDLNIYYEASDALPVGLEGQQGQLLAPLGCKVTCSKSGSLMPYDLMNQQYPGDYALRVGAWEDDLLTLSGPGLVALGNQVPGATTALNQGYEYNNKWLYFWRENGSYTKAKIKRVVTVSNNGYWVTQVEIFENTWEYFTGLSWYNCFSFGNGVESNRIRDDFNESFIRNGVRASTVLEEPYEEERRKHGLIYSGLYNSTSGVNDLNQFIQAEKITKDLMPSYGSIQKLYARNKDLITLCEDKVLQIFVDKDILYNADGNTQLLATNRVLGTAEPFKGNFGISKNPESFAAESFRAYFTDKQRGAVLRLSQDGLTPISKIGMHDFFRDNLRDGGKLYGSFDSHKGDYNLSIFYANGENLLVNPGFEQGGVFLTQESSEYLLNPEFTDTYPGSGPSYLKDTFGNDRGTFQQPYSSFMGSGGGLSGWDNSNDVTFVSGNAPASISSRNTDGVITNQPYSNNSNSDGSGAVKFENITAGDYLDTDFFSLVNTNWGGNPQFLVTWDLFNMIPDSSWTSTHKMRVWVLDKDGNGFIIPSNEIKFEQNIGGSMHCSFLKTLQAAVDPTNPNLPGPGGSYVRYRLRFEIEGSGWGNSSFKIDNVEIGVPHMLTTNWDSTMNSNNTNGTLNSLYHYQPVSITPGTYKIEATVHSVVTPSDLEAGFMQLPLTGSTGYVNILDNATGSAISAPGVYHKNLLINDTGTFQFSFGEFMPNYTLDAISLKKITPVGGTVSHWDLNDSGSGNPYPGKIYFDVTYWGKNLIGFNEALPDMFLSQGIIGENFINESKYRVTFKISNYSQGSVAVRLFNDVGEGFDVGGFSSDGTHEIFAEIGDAYTYNPNHKDKFAIYVETGSNFTGRIDDITLEKYGGGKTITFNEEAKGWVSFKSFVPEYGVSVVNQYYTMSNGRLYHHHRSDVDRNTFYGEFEDSSITPILNLQPDVVKNFNTLNYEGSQSKIDDFTTFVQNGVSYTDEEYYNLYGKDGWYVNKIHTDKQEGQVNEFIEKEGKWFNYIKSDFGTIDPKAFNFQGIGIVDDVEIIQGEVCGCMDDTMSNYNPLATVDCGCERDTGTCCIPHIPGCTDPGAINFQYLATQDDGSCIYQKYGCTDPAADNYDSLATIDDGSCLYPTQTGCMDQNASNYSAGYIYDCAGALNGSNTSCCNYPGCTDPTAINYCATCNVDDGSCIATNIYGCIDDGSLGQAWWDASAYPTLYNTNSYPGVSAINYDPTATVDNGSCIYEGGGDGVYGCTDDGGLGNGASPARDQAWWNGTYANFPYPTGGTYPVDYPAGDQNSPYYQSPADNYNPLATIDDGSCLYSNGFTPGGGGDPCPCVPCETVPADTSCSLVPGCCDPQAANYNLKATCDDGSCTYDGSGGVSGCTDPLATNYDPLATIAADWTCIYDRKSDARRGCCPDPNAFNYGGIYCQTCDNTGSLYTLDCCTYTTQTNEPGDTRTSGEY